MQYIQLRRDRYLGLLRGIPHELVQMLRHFLLNDKNELFPAEILQEVNAQARDRWNNAAKMKVAEHAANPPAQKGGRWSGPRESPSAQKEHVERKRTEV